MKITDELIQERIDKYNEENEGITLNDTQAKQWRSSGQCASTRGTAY